MVNVQSEIETQDCLITLLLACSQWGRCGPEYIPEDRLAEAEAHVIVVETDLAKVQSEQDRLKSSDHFAGHQPNILMMSDVTALIRYF